MIWVGMVSIRAFFSLGVVNRIKVVFVVVGAVVTLSVIVKSVPTIKDRPTLTGVIFPVVVAVVRFSVSEIIFYAIVVAVVIYLTVVVVDGLVTMMLSVGMFTSVTGFSPPMPGLLPASSISFQDNEVEESPGENEDADDVSGEVDDPTEGVIKPVMEVV